METTQTPIPRKEMGRAGMISPRSREVMTMSFLCGNTIRSIAKDARVQVGVVEDVLRHEFNSDPRKAPTGRVIQFGKAAA